MSVIHILLYSSVRAQGVTRVERASWLHCAGACWLSTLHSKNTCLALPNVHKIFTPYSEAVLFCAARARRFLPRGGEWCSGISWQTANMPPAICSRTHVVNTHTYPRHSQPYERPGTGHGGILIRRPYRKKRAQRADADIHAWPSLAMRSHSNSFFGVPPIAHTMHESYICLRKNL